MTPLKCGWPQVPHPGIAGPVTPEYLSQEFTHASLVEVVGADGRTKPEAVTRITQAPVQLIVFIACNQPLVPGAHSLENLTTITPKKDCIGRCFLHPSPKNRAANSEPMRGHCPHQAGPQVSGCQFRDTYSRSEERRVGTEC